MWENRGLWRQVPVPLGEGPHLPENPWRCLLVRECLQKWSVKLLQIEPCLDLGKNILIKAVFHEICGLSSTIFVTVTKIMLILLTSTPDLCEQWKVIPAIRLSSETAEVPVTDTKVTTLLTNSLMPWDKFSFRVHPLKKHGNLTHAQLQANKQIYPCEKRVKLQKNLEMCET